MRAGTRPHPWPVLAGMWLIGALGCDSEDSGLRIWLGEQSEPVASAPETDSDVGDSDCVPTDDWDGDGVPAPTDCDDSDPQVYPDAPELCNGHDDDCDGIIDEGTTSYDDDGDGFTEEENDCDDGDAAIHPDADEVLDNDVDENCDGLAEESEVQDTGVITTTKRCGCASTCSSRTRTSRG